jgi:hypothetical protein
MAPGDVGIVSSWSLVVVTSNSSNVRATETSSTDAGEAGDLRSALPWPVKNEEAPVAAFTFETSSAPRKIDHAPPTSAVAANPEREADDTFFALLTGRRAPAAKPEELPGGLGGKW